MSYGRRPSGLCGGAILIAARIHGFKRTTRQIVNVVHVCDETIRRRLEEFAKTDAANLTKEEFDKILMSENYEEGGMDPPCFKKSLLNEKIQNFVDGKAKEIDNFLSVDENKSLFHESNNLLHTNTHNIPLINVYNSGIKNNVEIKYCLRKNYLKKSWDKNEKSNFYLKNNSE